MTIRDIQTNDIATIFEVRIATWHNECGAEELEGFGITPESVEQMMAV